MKHVFITVFKSALKENANFLTLKLVKFKARGDIEAT